MPKTIITKSCYICKQTKPLSEFYKDHKRKDKHQYGCKDCHSKHEKKYYQTEHGKTIRRKKVFRYRIRYPKRYIAHKTLTNAIRYNRLPPAKTLKCYYCSTQAEDYHHWHGYEPKHRLDVIPVCKKCHREIL